MIQIPLSTSLAAKQRGMYCAIVDDIDADLAGLQWYARVSRNGLNPLVYAVRNKAVGEGRGRTIRMHRLIWERAHGPMPAGFEVDHVRHGEHGGLDNRRCNLRLATHARNIANGRLRSSNTSGFKGVHFVKRIGRWQALIRVDGKRAHLGYFDSAEEASVAYTAVARKRFGEFAETYVSGL